MIMMLLLLLMMMIMMLMLLLLLLLLQGVRCVAEAAVLGLDSALEEVRTSTSGLVPRQALLSSLFK
jgi:hypothetical protein